MSNGPSTSHPDPSATPPEERTWAMLGHLSAFATFVLPAFGHIIGPLLVWLVKKDTMPFAADQAKEALNFNITITLLAIVAALSILVLIGFVLLPLVAIFWFVFTIVAAVAANGGTTYRYPLCLRLVT